MRQNRLDDVQGSYWPGVADSLLAALMIVMLLAFGGLVLFALNPNGGLKLIQERRIFDTIARKNTELDADNKKLRARIQQLEWERAIAGKLIQQRQIFDAVAQKNTELEGNNRRLQAEIEKLETRQASSEPPIIELADAAKDVHFKIGTSQISAEFSNNLREKEFPTLVQILDSHPTVDTIEIIGHTDDLPVASTRSNLDGNLSQVVAGLLESRILSAGSNADLGLMRAVAVQEEWRQWLANGRVVLPRPIEVRCYSAANGIPPPGVATLPKDQRDEKARRIEIRFAQLNKAATSSSSPP